MATATNNRMIWKANALICAVIVVGFALLSSIGYQSSRTAFETDAERTSLLAVESAAGEIDDQFSEPIDVSLAMAHDPLLLDVLAGEGGPDSENAQAALDAYLASFRRAFGFDSAFLVSTSTNRYYHFSGADRTLEPGDPENSWYFDFLERDEAYSLNVDNDEATEDEITVFVNARIVDEAGTTRGVVGVGFRLTDLEDLLAAFETRTDTRVRLLNPDGSVAISTDASEDGRTLFDGSTTAQLTSETLDADAETQDLWCRAEEGNRFIVSRYLPNLEWFLVIDHDTSQLDARMLRQFTADALVVVAVVGIVLIVATSIFRRFSERAISRTVALEQKRKSIFQEVAEQLYDDIYEVDITHNRAANETTERYFERYGVPPGTPFDRAIVIIAEHIAPDDRQGYLDTFAPDAVLAAMRAGRDNLTYEFRSMVDETTWQWVRVYAHLFLWDDDESVRMLVYRQNIDDEKQREARLFEQMQHDSLTGLFNKAATQSTISARLADDPDRSYAFFILDIDDFKSVNDRYGHRAGDEVLSRFGATVRAQFRSEDIVGRIGGDEFVAFAPFGSVQAAEAKADELVKALRFSVPTDAGACSLSASVGVAFAVGATTDFDTLYRHADKALYRVKGAGKNGFARYES